MTRSGKWTNPNAQKYLASQEDIRYQIRQQVNCEMLDRVPLRMFGVIETEHHRGDLSNIIKAVEDAAQGTIYKNDLYIDEINFVRKYGRNHAVINIEVII